VRWVGAGCGCVGGQVVARRGVSLLTDRPAGVLPSALPVCAQASSSRSSCQTARWVCCVVSSWHCLWRTAPANTRNLGCSSCSSCPHPPPLPFPPALPAHRQQVCVDMGEPILEGPKVPTTLAPTQVTLPVTHPRGWFWQQPLCPTRSHPACHHLACQPRAHTRTPHTPHHTTHTHTHTTPHTPHAAARRAAPWCSRRSRWLGAAGR
jgi:hypothetical protein